MCTVKRMVALWVICVKTTLQKAPLFLTHWLVWICIQKEPHILAFSSHTFMFIHSFIVLTKTLGICGWFLYVFLSWKLRFVTMYSCYYLRTRSWIWRSPILINPSLQLYSRPPYRWHNPVLHIASPHIDPSGHRLMSHCVGELFGHIFSFH